MQWQHLSLLLLLLVFVDKFNTNDIQTNDSFDAIKTVDKTVTNVCSDDDKFKCTKSGECIDKYKFCDYIVDCSDGSDEIQCGTCNFQNGTMCGWKNAPQSSHWRIVTTNNNEHYLTTGVGKSDATLVSPSLKSLDTHCRMIITLKFITQIEHTRSTAYIFMASNQDHGMHIPFVYSSNVLKTYTNWTETSIPLFVENIKDFYPVIDNAFYEVNITVYNRATHDELRIKSIRFESCNLKRTIGDCDFEDGNFCHWQPYSKGSNMPWKIGTGSQLKQQTSAPTADHTFANSSGHFMYTHMLPGTKEADSFAYILSPYWLTFDACLSFWYYMDGSDFMRLRTLGQYRNQTQQNVLDQVTLMTGGEWLYHEINLQWQSKRDYHLYLQAMLQDHLGFLAVDDIKVQFVRCQLCDFEDNLCSYNITKSNGTSTWARMKGQQVKNLTTISLPDHSTSTLDGSMMIFIPHQTNDRSWLTTTVATASSYRCLQFYYYISDDEVATLEVIHRSGFGHSDSSEIKKNGYVKRTQSTALFGIFWHKVELTLPPIDNSVIEFIGTAGDIVNDGFVALDDIRQINGKCRTPVSCDFEYDECGWLLKQDNSDVILMRQSPAKRTDNSKCNDGPSSDHTLESGTGHYLYFCTTSPYSQATITSDDVEANQDYCLSFWTYFINGSNIKLEVDLSTYDSTVSIASLFGENSTSWKQHQINIDGTKLYDFYFFTIIISNIDAVNVIQGVAIDDIQLTPFKCGYHPKPVDPDNKPKQPKTPLPNFQCAFEMNTCQYQSLKNGVQFELTNPTKKLTARPNGPLTDHTTHSYVGGFLELELMNKASKLSDWAELQSKNVISPNGEFENVSISQVCVDFWYIMNGEAINWLNVSTVFSQTTSQVVLHIEGSYGPTWRHKAVNINFDRDFHLRFAGFSSNLTTGVLALDDIQVTVGSCPIEALCDFSFDLCGWDNNVSLPLHWLLGSGSKLDSTGQFNYSLQHDHSSNTKYGQYLYINATSLDSVDQTAQLISQMLKPNQKCLQFWYYFYGVNVGSLNVYVVYNGLINLKYLLKSEINSDAQQWMFSQIPIEKHYFDMDFQFVIEVKRGDEIRDEYRVALDDVEIKENCQPIASCDFEDDFCAYTNMDDLSDSKFYAAWTRAYGKDTVKNFANSLAPNSDHTNGDEGIFVYIDKGPQSIIYTPLFTLNSAQCVSFYYYLASKDASKMPLLNVQLTQLNYVNDTVDTVQVSQVNDKTWITDAKEGQWALHSMLLNHTGRKMMLIFEGVVNNDHEQLIALDDISMMPGKCDHFHQKKFACVAEPQSKHDFVNYSQVCDFVKDCFNGQDEQNCGYKCIFGKDTCYWVVKNVTSTFLLVDLSHRKGSPFKTVMPLRDHQSQNDFIGTYLRLYDTPGPFVDNPEATLESPWLQNAGSLCSFTFYYYMYDPVDKNALLRVNLIEPNNPLGIEVFRREGDSGNFWNQDTINLGRIRGQFKLQINAKLLIGSGGGAIAIDQLSFSQSECMPLTISGANMFSCTDEAHKYHCKQKQFCFGESRLCDYQDDCGDDSDESSHLCDTLSRRSLKCDFESGGTCFWKIDTYYNSTTLNGFRWGSIDVIDDYAYGLKRDHTFNNEFGHVVYLWNQDRLPGKIQSPLVIPSGSDCSIRLYYTYKTKDLVSIVLGNNASSGSIGQLNIYLKFSTNGTKFLYYTVNQFYGYYFERIELPLNNTKTEPFFVALEVVPGSDSYGMWAIDDVTFSSGCKPMGEKTVTDPTFTPFPVVLPTKANQCKNNFFACDARLQLRCISHSKVCDFVVDCDDGTDEMKCGENSFQEGWYAPKNGALYFVIGSDGVARTKVQDGTDTMAFLQSTLFHNSGPNCGITFEYYLDTNAERIALDLIYQHKKPSYLVREILFDTDKLVDIKYAGWKMAKVFIGQHIDPWELHFVAYKDIVDNRTDTIRLRNVHMVNCAAVSPNDTECKEKNHFKCTNGYGCVSPDQVCDFDENCQDGSDEKNCKYKTSFRCSFESNHNNTAAVCGLDLNKWKRFEALDTRNFIGPGIDHTTDSELGHFMMVTEAVFQQTSIAQTPMITPMFEPDTSGNCIIRFWYMMNGKGKLVISKKFSGSNDLKKIATINTSPDDTFVWKRFSEPLINKMECQIVLSATIDDVKTKTFLAIDDISFTSSCKLSGKGGENGTSTTPSSMNCIVGDKFECYDHTCISFEQVCDFYPTCKQGEDEYDCPAVCTFDKPSDDPLCYWDTTDDDGDPVKVHLSRENAISAAHLTKYYPPTDNTWKNKSGHFMLIYPANFSDTVDAKHDTVIYSSDYNSASPECTFSMDFLVAANGTKTMPNSTYTLSLIEIFSDGTVRENPLRIISSMESSYWYKWTTLTVGIGRRANSFQLKLTRQKNAHMSDALAIDNIHFDKCSYTKPHDANHLACDSATQFTCGRHFNCIPLDQVCDFKKDCPDGKDEQNCTNVGITFEEKNPFEKSGFSLGKPGLDGFNWKIISGPAPQRSLLNTGPPFDHTYFNASGHYLFYIAFDYGVGAWLLTPMMKPTITTKKCSLKFYYYLYGFGENEINVYLRNHTADDLHKIQTIHLNVSTDEWLEAIVPLQSPGGRFQVIVAGVSSGNYAAIGLDDVALSNGCVVDHSQTSLPPDSTTVSNPTTNSGKNSTTATPTPNPGGNCDTGTYYCAPDDTCLPLITRCNFVKDCSDGSDEHTPDCTQSFCPISNDNLDIDCGLSISYQEGSSYIWTFATAAEYSKFPNLGHLTNDIPSCVYLNLTDGKKDDYSYVISQSISQTSASCLLSFEFACEIDNCPIQMSIVSHLNGNDVKSLQWIPLNNELVDQEIEHDHMNVYRARAYIGERNNFRISIGSLKEPTITTGYVLLSNITFEDCMSAKYNANPSSIHCDSSSQFQCVKSYGNCIPQSDVCDYQQDCPLSEDESNCTQYNGRCDFENIALCDVWSFEQQDIQLTFMSESGEHGLSYLPQMDHTQHLTSNYYLSFHSNMIINYINTKIDSFFTKYKSNLINGTIVGCRVRFWYNLIGDGCNLKVYKRYDGSEYHLLKSVDANKFDYWQKMDLLLDETKHGTARNFEVVLQAKLERGLICSVNIDDTSFTPSCVITDDSFVPNINDTLNLCKPNLMCANKNCYDFVQRCNFVDDCGDGSDEQDCPNSCPFEDDSHPLCGWYVPNGLQANIVRINGPSPMTRVKGGTGPIDDHTKNTDQGHYLVATNFSTYHTKMELHSPYFSASGSNCRFSFSYFLNEPNHKDKINLYLKINSHPPNITKIWSHHPTKGHENVWNTNKVYVGKQKGFSLLFEAIQGTSNSKADLAFDDFQFTNCRSKNETELVCSENEYRCNDQSQCIVYWRMCDGEVDCTDSSDETKHCSQVNGTCWFVDSNWRTHCGWIDLKRDFNWTFESVAMKTINHDIYTGPQSLLNNKYNYVVMKAKGHKYGEQAAIASPQFPASEGICSLGFHYYMYGADTMGELAIYTLGVDGKRIDYFRLRGNQGPSWNYVSNVIVGNPTNFRVVFEGIVGSNQYSDIAIGYVSFSPDCIRGKWIEKINNNMTGDTCSGFYCHQSHQCISIDWVCDGAYDCKDGTDEYNCKVIHHHPPTHSPVIIVSVVILLILATIISGMVFARQYLRLRRQHGMRRPFFDNSNEFETTTHRDLDYTISTGSTGFSFELRAR